jgi:hypothetical protein
MRNIPTKATVFIAFIIGVFISCKHEAPEPTSGDACLKTIINVTGTVTNVTSSAAGDGRIAATATGASGFTYSLNNGPYQGNGNFSNLAIGSYAVIARSSSGCIGSAQFTVSNNDPCAGVTVSITATTVNATSSTSSDGSITATASGGTGLQYKLNSGTFQTSGTFNNLAPGTYTVTAKNSNGCLGTAQFAISAGNVCGSKNIILNSVVTNSDKCTATGSLTINASGSTGFSYQINSGAYQSSNVFSNLPAGAYTISVKDLDNCTKSTTATIGTGAAGPLFSSVKTLVISQCKPCHINGGNNGGVNFDLDCDIVAKKDRIKVRSVDGIPSPMPTNGSLTAAEKQKITDWINAGGKYNN